MKLVKSKLVTRYPKITTKYYLNRFIQHLNELINYLLSKFCLLDTQIF